MPGACPAAAPVTAATRGSRSAVAAVVVPALAADEHADPGAARRAGVVVIPPVVVFGLVPGLADALGARRAVDGLPVGGGVEADHARRPQPVEDVDPLE